MMRATLFGDRPDLPEPRPGPLFGRRVLLVVAPVGSAGGEVRQLTRRLGEQGVQVGIACECQGEARDERRRPIYPHRLLVEIDPAQWDALVFVGGPGAARVASDPLAQTLARAQAARGALVAAVGAGQAVLTRAGVTGPSADDAPTLADAVELRLGARRRSRDAAVLTGRRLPT
jgi:putative intracellular protease/amidase